ncbi:uncharacterized protein LOC143027490 [Oratosquilla oratoria]|uniref:uncharacterized protein LOC143027490 n=1 Tax=Oratosquilla oratoria TaxID=337810 RepID=UPI003F75C16D
MQELREQVAPLLVEIFNESLRTGEMSRDWREANVTPILKKRDRANPSHLTNLIKFFHVMLQKYDRNIEIDIPYLDIQKAFDNVPHKRLMSKLSVVSNIGDTYKVLYNLDVV